MSRGIVIFLTDIFALRCHETWGQEDGHKAANARGRSLDR
ncbi:MAG: hypothetical protein KatS3mg024_1005 [Armatimonadota bacterium]|nr:MAG: hypothetical protein KatS3mg024_1005 [Armatimonadota bacterium]